MAYGFYQDGPRRPFSRGGRRAPQGGYFRPMSRGRSRARPAPRGYMAGGMSWEGGRRAAQAFRRGSGAEPFRDYGPRASYGTSRMIYSRRANYGGRRW